MEDAKVGTSSERKAFRDFLNKVRVRDVMSKEVVSVNEYEEFSRVEEIFRLNQIRHLPVVNQAGRVVGVISQRDLYRICPPRIDEEGQRFYTKDNLDEYILRHVMSSSPLTMKEEDSLADALFKIANTHFGSVLIVDQNERLCGIITRTDIIKAAVRVLKE